ncbi:MAG: hypothetical protein SNJ63_03985, partial [Sphingomonadaceae bacterium]
MKRIAIAALGAFAAFTAAPALALGPVIKPCALSDITPGAEACAGFYQGNLLNGNAQGLADQQAALALIGLTWDTGTWGTLPFDNDGNSIIDFGVQLFGPTWIGIHFGAG